MGYRVNSFKATKFRQWATSVLKSYMMQGYVINGEKITRFLIIDEVEIYYIGASLKDLGKKWFAFSLLEVESFGLMERVKKAIG